MMRKILILVAVTVLAFGSTAAFARGHGWNKGGCYNAAPGAGQMMGNCFNCPVNDPSMTGIGAAVEMVSEAQAKENVQKYIDGNLKGYKITDTTTQTNPRGFNVYTVKASDTSGNTYVFFVGPYGHVRGPILESEYNNRLNRMPVRPMAPVAPSVQ